MKKLLLVLSLLSTQHIYAFFPMANGIPELPSLPIFGDFDPNRLRVHFNEFTGVQPDFSRESRVVNQIADSVIDGDVEYLLTGAGKEIFSIFMEADADKTKGGVIILHNRGQHANWGDTIKPLRVGLAEKGWDTLSVQMPVLDKHAKYYDYVPIFPYSHDRIEAAIKFYKDKGIDNIVLIAHGCGVHMSMSYLDKYGDDKIKAYVGIGMGATDYRQKLVKGFPINKMSVPILDIYADKDFKGVQNLAEYRAKLIEIAGNKKSIQKVVKNADHYYKDSKAVERLIGQVSEWLDTL